MWLSSNRGNCKPISAAQRTEAGSPQVKILYHFGDRRALLRSVAWRSRNIKIFICSTTFFFDMAADDTLY